MREKYLDYSPPQIGEEEVAEVLDTLRSDWITTGPKVKRFEEEFASYVGAQAALAVSSATDAMHVALAAWGIGEGTEVISTTMTFCSTIHVIEHMGARPVLVDVMEDTLNIDPAQVEEAITSKTRAILPVHLYGHPCDMDQIVNIGKRRNLKILEDAAHALPAKYKNMMVGSIGALTAFSFYATKNLTTAEGGMLTGDRDTIEKARLWSLHGMSRDGYKRYSAEGSWHYEVLLPGFKCNMTDIQAALGLQQLKKLERFQLRRREIVDKYRKGLGACEEVELPVERPQVESAWHIYPLRLRLEQITIGRDRFIEELKLRKIGSSVHFIPIHLHKYYREKYGYSPHDFPNAYSNYLRLVSLPLNLRMSDQDVEDVIEAVRDIILQYRR